VSKTESDHKYAYKFGKTDTGILLSIIMASLFLVTVAASGVIAADAKADSGIGTSPGALAVAAGVVVVLFAPCFEYVLILVVLTIISYLAYRLVSWLEERCESCSCCGWPRCWACCAGKLFCWMVTVSRWMWITVTSVLAVITVITFVWCLVTSVVALVA